MILVGLQALCFIIGLVLFWLSEGLLSTKLKTFMV